MSIMHMIGTVYEGADGDTTKTVGKVTKPWPVEVMTRGQTFLSGKTQLICSVPNATESTNISGLHPKIHKYLDK